jgi:hypothetical protein
MPENSRCAVHSGVTDDIVPLKVPLSSVPTSVPSSGPPAPLGVV